METEETDSRVRQVEEYKSQGLRHRKKHTHKESVLSYSIFHFWLHKQLFNTNDRLFRRSFYCSEIYRILPTLRDTLHSSQDKSNHMFFSYKTCCVQSFANILQILVTCVYFSILSLSGAVPGFSMGETSNYSF